MNRTREAWKKVKPDAFLAGSIQQARNIIEMMQQDIAELYGEFDKIDKISAECCEKYVAEADGIVMDILCGKNVKP